VALVTAPRRTFKQLFHLPDYEEQTMGVVDRTGAGFYSDTLQSGDLVFYQLPLLDAAYSTEHERFTVWANQIWGGIRDGKVFPCGDYWAVKVDPDVDEVHTLPSGIAVRQSAMEYPNTGTTHAGERVIWDIHADAQRRIEYRGNTWVFLQPDGVLLYIEEGEEANEV